MKKFLISAGHGGVDPGNTASGRKESDIVLDFRNILASKLRANGCQVTVDGGLRENLPLSRAIKMIVGNNISIEFHTNTGQPTARGIEVIGKSSDAALCKRIAKAIHNVTGSPLRRDEGFFAYDKLQSEQGRTLGFVGAGGIIVELFFQTNKFDLATYDATKWLIASAIAEVLFNA
jgi:N-acetylmuramoyl-L-alanine amidase